MAFTMAAPGIGARGAVQAPAARPLRRSALAPPVLRAQCIGRSRGFCTPIIAAASRGGLAHPGEEANATGGGSGSGSSGASSPSLGPLGALSAPSSFAGCPIMAKGGGGEARNFGAGSALGMVLERSKMDFVMPTPPQQAPKLDDGGSGGDSGKNIHNGGGGGDGDGGDDDDYFGEEGDGDGEGGGGGGGGGGFGFFRAALPELYDRLTLGAVLQEWYRTVADLPLFIRRAVEMGLFSSAQLVRFLSMDVRPGAARAVSRALPSEWARGFVGRLMADPAFVQKLVFEQALAFAASMAYEWRARGERFREELDLALINSVGMAAAVGATVWVVAPSRAYGAVHKFPWQQMLAGLPSCVFDASGPLRHYTSGARLGGLFASMAQLSAVGAIAGGATAAASQAAVAVRRRADPAWQPSVPVPEVGRSSAGLGAFFALNANTRYQLLGGVDRYLFHHTSALWTYLGLSLAARGAAAAAGEASRPWWQGLGGEAAAGDAAQQQRAKRVRRVRRKVGKSGTAAGALPSGAERQAALAAAAAQQQQQQLGTAAAAAAAAGAGALGDYAPVAAAAGADAGSGSSGGALAAFAPVSADDALEVSSDAAAQQHGADAVRALGALEASLQQQLASAPAVMGGAAALHDMVEHAALSARPAEQQQQQQQQQQRQQGDEQQLAAALQRLPSLSDSAVGAALRDAVAEGVAA